MGEKKYLDKVSALFEKSSVVDYKSIERIIKDKNHHSLYAKQLVRNLILSGKIKRITKGYYTNKGNYQLIIFCFKPSYFGLQDALSFHNIWEQETIPVILTTKKVRSGIRKVFGKNIMIRRIDKKYLFGFDYFKDNQYFFPYSDIEKTLIDLVYFRQKIDRETLIEIKNKINKEKLNLYLRKYPKQIKERVNLLISK